jgi:hypothetical protein
VIERKLDNHGRPAPTNISEDDGLTRTSWERFNGETLSGYNRNLRTETKKQAVEGRLFLIEEK